MAKTTSVSHLEFKSLEFWEFGHVISVNIAYNNSTKSGDISLKYGGDFQHGGRPLSWISFFIFHVRPSLFSDFSFAYKTLRKSDKIRC